MVIKRGEIFWAHLEDPRGSEPGFHRPVVIVSADSFNRSRIQTVLAAVITSNTGLLEAPGNVSLPSAKAGLSRDSVINVSQVITLDKGYLGEKTGHLSSEIMDRLDAGLRLVLGLNIPPTGTTLSRPQN